MVVSTSAQCELVKKSNKLARWRTKGSTRSVSSSPLMSAIRKYRATSTSCLRSYRTKGRWYRVIVRRKFKWRSNRKMIFQLKNYPFSDARWAWISNPFSLHLNHYFLQRVIKKKDVSGGREEGSLRMVTIGDMEESDAQTMTTPPCHIYFWRVHIKLICFSGVSSSTVQCF